MNVNKNVKRLYYYEIVYLMWWNDCYRVTENGRETVMSYENGVLKSKTVNGVPQSLTYS